MCLCACSMFYAHQKLIYRDVLIPVKTGIPAFWRYSGFSGFRGDKSSGRKNNFPAEEKSESGMPGERSSNWNYPRFYTLVANRNSLG